MSPFGRDGGGLSGEEADDGEGTTGTTRRDRGRTRGEHGLFRVRLQEVRRDRFERPDRVPERRLRSPLGVHVLRVLREGRISRGVRARRVRIGFKRKRVGTAGIRSTRGSGAIARDARSRPRATAPPSPRTGDARLARRANDPRVAGRAHLRDVNRRPLGHLHRLGDEVVDGFSALHRARARCDAMRCDSPRCVRIRRACVRPGVRATVRVRRRRRARRAVNRAPTPPLPNSERPRDLTVNDHIRRQADRGDAESRRRRRPNPDAGRGSHSRRARRTTRARQVTRAARARDPHRAIRAEG